MSAFTPGPWAQHPTYPWFVKQDMSCSGVEIADGVTICSTLNADRGSGFFPTMEEGEANARLIAAAPELLEALRTARCCVRDGSAVANVIDAAILKATGGDK